MIKKRKKEQKNFCNKRDKKTTINSFLMDAFGTENLQQIYDVIEENH